MKLKMSKKRMGRRAFFRRGLAMLLCAALVSGQALGAVGVTDGLLEPTQVSDPALELPHVEIQGNAVQDAFGNLTGFFELALRVQTPSDKTFRSLSVTLNYDPEVLMPVGWEWAAPTDGSAVVSDVDLNCAEEYDVQLPVKKYDKITGGVAQSGVVAASGGGTVTTAAGDKAHLFFNAETYKPVAFPDMTTLVVLRFYVNSPDKFFLADNGDILYGGSPANIADFVGFATDDEIFDSFSPAASALWYRAGDNEFYHVPQYAADNTKTEPVTVRVNGAAYSITAPVTKNERVQAKRAGEDPATTADPANYYSYLSNHLPAANIGYALVSQESFATGGVDIDNLAVIIYTDWDNTILGTQVVPKNTDVRKLVNAYVAENFVYNDADLRAPADPSSLARTDSYRGKYPHSGPAPDGNTNGAVLDGEKFPLTNKLDYVFLKRPMEQEMIDDPGNPGTLIPSGKWVQKTDPSGTPVYDKKYPFVYGWAACTASNFENTWTTLKSTGELSDYAVDATGVASVTYDGDPDFAFVDFQNGISTNEIYVKAVYEPGEDLLDSGIVYRMVKEPYYNKYNDLISTEGGAYSVEFAYERSNSKETGLVQGVARAREPAIRQDTTPDLREYGQENVSSTTDKSKTTYTRVDVGNAETVEVALTISARSNQIDYYLVDLYSSNVVAGGQRSEPNSAQASPVPDNYAYTGAANDYDTRQGRAGFVIAGTMNSILEKASNSVRNIDPENEYASYYNYMISNDINLRAPDGSTFEDRNSFVSAGMSDLVKDAVQAAYDAHLTGNNMWWDKEHDHADLTWHQLQLYITDGMLYADSASEPSAKTVTWCRLHSECLSIGGSKPTNWEELLDKAVNSPGDLDGMTPPDIALFNLRADGQGSAYVQPAEFKADIIAAVTNYPGTVTTTDPTWDEVQYYIDHGSYPTDLADAIQYSKDHYWWYGNTSKPTDWAGVTAAANTANTDGREALLNTLEDAYDKLTATPNDRQDWIALTENLAKDDQGNPFDSFADFKTALKDAVNSAALAGLGSVSLLTWGQAQYHILHRDDLSYTFPLAPDAGQQAEISAYWWHNGGEKVKSLKTLLTAAWNANHGNSASLDAMVVADLTAYADLRFRKNFKGGEYASETELMDFKQAVKQLVSDAGTAWEDLTWAEIQYYIIHGVRASDSSIAGIEAMAYYWWQTREAGSPVTIAGIDEDVIISKMIEAAFRYKKNGNINAWNNLSSANLKSAWLAAKDDGSNTYTDLPKITDLDDFKTKMSDLVASATPAGSYTPPTLTWYQVQHYLATDPNEYISDPNDPALAPEIYWWKNQENNPNAPPPPTPVDDLVENMLAFCKGEKTEAQFKATITLPVLNTLCLKRTWNGTTAGGFSALNLAQAKTKLVALARAAYEPATSTISLTWYQVQDFVLTGGPLKSAADAYATATTSPAWTWVPEWALNAGTYGLQKDTIGLFSVEDEHTVSRSPIESTVDGETGALVESYTETTETRTLDGETGILTVITRDETVITETRTDETGVAVKTTVSVVLRTLTVNLYTGETHTQTTVEPPVITTAVTELVPPVQEEPAVDGGTEQPPAQDEDAGQAAPPTETPDQDTQKEPEAPAEDIPAGDAGQEPPVAEGENEAQAPEPGGQSGEIPSASGGGKTAVSLAAALPLMGRGLPAAIGMGPGESCSLPPGVRRIWSLSGAGSGMLFYEAFPGLPRISAITGKGLSPNRRIYT